MSLANVAKNFTLTDTVPHQITALLKAAYPNNADFMLYCKCNIIAASTNGANVLMFGAADVAANNGVAINAGQSFTMGDGFANDIPLINCWVAATAQPLTFTFQAYEA